MNMQSPQVNRTFTADVCRLIKHVPPGMVTTYGDLAAMAGHPGAARIVGGIAHYGSDDLPWHRLVNVRGGLASGYPGGREVQQQLLEQDGLVCINYRVDNFEDHRWRP